MRNPTGSLAEIDLEVHDGLAPGRRRRGSWGAALEIHRLDGLAVDLDLAVGPLSVVSSTPFSLVGPRLGEPVEDSRRRIVERAGRDVLIVIPASGAKKLNASARVTSPILQLTPVRMLTRRHPNTGPTTRRRSSPTRLSANRERGPRRPALEVARDIACAHRQRARLEASRWREGRQTGLPLTLVHSAFECRPRFGGLEPNP